MNENRKSKNVLDWNHQNCPVISNIKRKLSGILEKNNLEAETFQRALPRKRRSKYSDQKLSKYPLRPLIIRTLTKERLSVACHYYYKEALAHMIHS